MGRAIKITTAKSSIEFGVTKFPDRKNRCLYRCRGAMIEPLAYFRCDDDADAFEKIIDFMHETFGTAGKEK